MNLYSLKALTNVWVLLMVATSTTFSVFEVGRVEIFLSVVIFSIALFKSCLIIQYFMEIGRESVKLTVAISAWILWLSVIFLGPYLL